MSGLRLQQELSATSQTLETVIQLAVHPHQQLSHEHALEADYQQMKQPNQHYFNVNLHIPPRWKVVLTI